MKQSSFIVITLFAVTSCFSQSTPPAQVKNSFEKLFPNATVKKWDKEDKDYEANFIKDGKSMAAIFEANGVLKETETSIKINELPVSVSDYVKTNYKGATIKEAAIIVRGNNKTYEAEVKGKDLLFNMNGKFLKAE